MKTFLHLAVLSSLCVGATSNASETPESNPTASAASTHARFVPERKDDFAWENDLIAFRAYGPALREGKEDAGIDCWLKRVDYPIVDKWYRQATEDKKTYHKDHGEGLDNYHVGSSAGCGGTALWIEGKRAPLNTFTEWKILEQSPQKTVFMLTYEDQINSFTYREEKTITIELDKRLFKAESTFYKDGKPAPKLPIAVGITTHDGKATTFSDAKAGWVAAWEKLEKQGLGTAVVMPPDKIKKVVVVEEPEPDASHGLLITETDSNGRIVYHAGYGWEKAGTIKTQTDWVTHLNEFSKSIN